MGHGGGLVVSVPAFYSDDPSSNPAGYLINFLYEKMKINKKEAGVGPFKKSLLINGCSKNKNLFFAQSLSVPLKNSAELRSKKMSSFKILWKLISLIEIVPQCTEPRRKR